MWRAECAVASPVHHSSLPHCSSLLSWEERNSPFFSPERKFLSGVSISFLFLSPYLTAIAHLPHNPHPPTAFVEMSGVHSIIFCKPLSKSNLIQTPQRYSQNECHYSFCPLSAMRVICASRAGKGGSCVAISSSQASGTSARVSICPFSAVGVTGGKKAGLLVTISLEEKSSQQLHFMYDYLMTTLYT